MDDLEEKQQLRFMCLELAIRQTKLTDDGIARDLNQSEAISMANDFYTFITKKDLN